MLIRIDPTLFSCKYLKIRIDPKNAEYSIKLHLWLFKYKFVSKSDGEIFVESGKFVRFTYDMNSSTESSRINEHICSWFSPVFRFLIKISLSYSIFCSLKMFKYFDFSSDLSVCSISESNV